MPIYLHVPYAEKDRAKRRGARWDPKKRSWYVPEGVSPGGLMEWIRLSNGRMAMPSRAERARSSGGQRAVPRGGSVVIATCPRGHEHRLELHLGEQTGPRFLPTCPDEAGVPYPAADLDDD